LMTGGGPTGVWSMPSSTWGGGIQRSRASLPPSAGPNGSSVVCAAASWPEASSLGTGNSPICDRKAAATSRAPDGSCPLIARLALAVKTVTTMAAPSSYRLVSLRGGSSHGCPRGRGPVRAKPSGDDGDGLVRALLLFRGRGGANRIKELAEVESLTEFAERLFVEPHHRSILGPARRR
jgi:hypothetical protein